MPVVGEFHAKFWKARANAPAPPATAATAWMYPGVQSVVTMPFLFGALQPLWDQLVWYVRLAERLWHWRAPANQVRLETWIAHLEAFDTEEYAIVERVVEAMRHPRWSDARHAVRAVATSPKFHHPEQWVAYGRALKANKGQAQNVFRHVKAVSELHGLADGPAALSNPEAHLLIELAYQGFAALGRPDRELVERHILTTH